MWGHVDSPSLLDVPEDEHINLNKQVESPKHSSVSRDPKASKYKRRRSEPYANLAASLSGHQFDLLAFGSHRSASPSSRLSEPSVKFGQRRRGSCGSAISESLPFNIGIPGPVPRRGSEPYVNRKLVLSSLKASSSMCSSQGSLTEDEDIPTSGRRCSEPFITGLNSSNRSSRSSISTAGLEALYISGNQDLSSVDGAGTDYPLYPANAPTSYPQFLRRCSAPVISPEIFKNEMVDANGDDENDLGVDSTCYNVSRRISFPCEEFKVTTEDNAYDVLKSVDMSVIKEKDKGPEHKDIGKLVGSEYERQSFFSIIPWHDVIFPHVFTCLPLQDLFTVRAVCRCAHACVDEYFTVCPVVNITRSSQRISRKAFRLVTHNNYRVRVLLLRQLKSWLTDAEFIPAISSHLVKVDLTSCTALSHVSIIALAGEATGLKELYLRECPWMTMEAVMMVAQNCHSLQRLDITGCWALQDQALITIAMYCRELVFLSIAKIYGITDNAIHWLAKNCRKLQHVNLHGCWRVSDNAIKTLGEYCTDLKMLQVKDCRDVTDISLARLRVRGVKVDIPQHPWRPNPDTQRMLNSIQLHLQI